MDEGAIGLVVFLASSFASATAWHALVRRFWVATFAATGTSLAIFHTFAAVYPGAPNKFYAIAVVFSAIYGAAISFGVGVPFWYVRKRKGAAPAL